MAFFESTNRLTIFCQLFCVMPFTYDKKSRKWQLNTSLVLWSLVVLVSLSISLTRFIARQSFTPEKGIVAITEVLIFVMIRVQGLLVVLETLIKYDQHIHLLNLFEDSYITFKCQNVADFQSSHLKQFSWRHFIYLSLGILFFCIINLLDYLQFNAEYNVIDCMLHTISFIITRLSYVYLMTLVSIIRKFYTQITPNLIYLDEISQPPMPPINVIGGGHVTHDDLRSVKSSCNRIWIATLGINNLSYVSLPIGLVNQLLWFVLYSFKFFMRWFGTNDTITFKGYDLEHWLSLVVAIVALLDVLFLTVTCKQAIDAVIK